VSIGNGCVVSPNVVIYSDVKIGKNTLLGDNASIREGCRIGDKCLISRNVSINYNTLIGNNTKVMDNTHLTGNMIIGNEVFISCLVATTNDNYIGKKGFHKKMKGPVIEDNASIGAGANLLPNTKIGHDAIVAAGAVVTKDVEPETVVMGVPARTKPTK
jgi:acetyltransferase-like isoleucine patch superfamily enzyme